MSKEIRKGLLVDSNNVITKDASDLLVAAFEGRDMHQDPSDWSKVTICWLLILLRN